MKNDFIYTKISDKDGTRSLYQAISRMISYYTLSLYDLQLEEVFERIRN